MMAASDPDFLVDLFAPFAPVTIRRMFSGHAVYREGVVFALAIRGEIFLKCDAESSPAFAAEGLAPFVYATRRGETTVGSYRRMPEACFDEEDVLRRWATLAWQAGLRSGSTGRRRPIMPP
ncbi:MAG: TfoX/Sxy family protein [Phreatobacter sp.]|uniref:TfoX/Sxy family protein n=1 Tax=Phreatobacter sp. TaxID=1966341 RepID=UPI002734C2F5|nr:TfoX/Sxy family protein [Phreatobacter sp.]MDP2803023.1 TfoX/Sxy family protein [Phreatobacter sp.]